MFSRIVVHEREAVVEKLNKLDLFLVPGGRNQEHRCVLSEPNQILEFLIKSPRRIEGELHIHKG